jgi:hypothetical protein
LFKLSVMALTFGRPHGPPMAPPKKPDLKGERRT